MERSAIRERSLSCNADPGLRCASSGLRKQRKRNAGRRVANHRTSGCGARPAGRARLSAFHRGTCGSDRTPPLSSSYALPGMGLVRNGRYPFPAIHSAAGCPADRSSCRPGVSTRSRPGAEVTSPHPREPHSLRQPVSPAGVLLRERDGTNVTTARTNINSHHYCGDKNNGINKYVLILIL